MRIDTTLQQFLAGELVEMLGNQAVRQLHHLGDGARMNRAAVDRMQDIIEPQIDPQPFFQDRRQLLRDAHIQPVQMPQKR